MAKQQTPDDGPADAHDAPAAAKPAGGRRKKLILAAAGVLILTGVGAAYATGLVGAHAAATTAEEGAQTGSVDLPEIVANLNAGPRRSAFVRLKARLELANKADEPLVHAAEPRMQDLFQTYLRDMRPEELRGSAGTYRLREELVARANVALAPARVTEILFVEILVQ